MLSASKGDDRNSMPHSRQCAATVALLVGRQLQGAQHLELVAGRAGGLLLVDGPGRAGRGQQVGVKALELDRVGARRGGRFDELQGHGERAVVVDAGLGDDKDVRRPAHRGSQRAGTPTATAPAGTSATHRRADAHDGAGADVHALHHGRAGADVSVVADDDPA
jgi:hypothetical protein